MTDYFLGLKRCTNNSQLKFGRWKVNRTHDGKWGWKCKRILDKENSIQCPPEYFWKGVRNLLQATNLVHLQMFMYLRQCFPIHLGHCNLSFRYPKFVSKPLIYIYERGSAVETWKNLQSVVNTETLENGLVSGRCWPRNTSPDFLSAAGNRGVAILTGELVCHLWHGNTRFSKKFADTRRRDRFSAACGMRTQGEIFEDSRSGHRGGNINLGQLHLLQGQQVLLVIISLHWPCAIKLRLLLVSGTSHHLNYIAQP